MNQPATSNPSNKNFVEAVYTSTIVTLRNIVLNIRKHLILFLFCLMVPILILLFIQSSKPTTYKASFTLIYEELTRKIYGDRIAKVNSLIEQKRYNKVGSLLGISVAVAEKIDQIEGKNILGDDLTKDLNTDKIPFVVVIYVKDTSVVDQVQDGLVGFLDTGAPFQKSRKKIKDKEVLEELEFINKELAQMDSLKRKLNVSTLTTASASQDKAENGTNLVYSFSYELYKKKQELERKVSMPNNLQVIDDVLAPTKVGRSYVILAAVGFCIGLVIYTLLILFIIPIFRYNDISKV